MERARNKIKLMRRKISEAEQRQLKLKNLVQVYVSQRPEITTKIIKAWLNSSLK